MAMPTGNMSILPSDNGGFSASHDDGTTHVFSDMPGLMAHVVGHYGGPTPKPNGGSPVAVGNGGKPVTKLTHM